jgi:hypothetical protein
VGGEDGAGPDGLDGLVEAQPVVDDGPAHPLQPEEPGVTLVGVEHLRLVPDQLEGPDAADAEQDLLAQPVLAVTAVEAVGDRAAVVDVLLDVGVEEVQRHPGHLRFPDLGHERGAGQVHLHPHVFDRLERHHVGVEVHVALALPAVGVELLAEVPVLVEEPDTGQRDAEPAGRLEVIAGEDAQAARVLGQGLGDPELGGEVGHRTQRALPGLEPPVALQVPAQVVVHLLHEGEEGPVGDQRLQAPSFDHGQQPDRVVGGGLPRVGVDPAEQVLCPLVPRPAEVHGQGLEGRQPLGEPGLDGEAAQCPHWRQTLAAGADPLVGPARFGEGSLVVHLQGDRSHRHR